MEQKCDLEIEANDDVVKAVFDFLKFDKTQRSDNENNLFDLFENDKAEHSICSGYSDSVEFDADLDRMYASDNGKHLYFKSYHKNLFRFASFLSSKFTARIKISWLERFEGDENIFVAVFEKACCSYFQRGKSYTIAPNYAQFIKENHLEAFVELHTRSEQGINNA